VTSTIEVGAGAHHLSFDAAHQRAWVALGESARTIVVLSTHRTDHPRVIGRFDPGFEVHDLAFSPDDARVWLTAAAGPDVSVLDAQSRRLLFRVRVGRSPQHVALTARYAYLTSGYGSTIEQVDARNGRILRRASTPYGSFELAADSRYVVVSSLLRGTLAIFTPQLRPVRVVHLAPATREVALSPPDGSPP
jgi:DNA-binding beta-propeller fold protein YncE